MRERSRHLGMGMHLAVGPSELDRFVAFSGGLFFVTLPHRYSHHLIELARHVGCNCAEAVRAGGLFPLQGGTVVCTVDQFVQILEEFVLRHGLKRTQVLPGFHFVFLGPFTIVGWSTDQCSLPHRLGAPSFGADWHARRHRARGSAALRCRARADGRRSVGGDSSGCAVAARVRRAAGWRAPAPPPLLGSLRCSFLRAAPGYLIGRSLVSFLLPGHSDLAAPLSLSISCAARTPHRHGRGTQRRPRRIRCC